MDIGKAVKKVISLVEHNHGKGYLMSLKPGEIASVDTVSSGSLALDRALGVGGLPRGRIIEVYGPESGGKTTLALHAIAEVQRAGGLAGFIDAEHALDPTYAAKVGVRVDELLLSQPDCGEQALQITQTLAQSGQVSLVVVDSVAALVPRAEIEGDMGDSHVGLQARLMSQGLRKLTHLCANHNMTVLFINQIRHKIGVMFGSPETTTGGNALKFYSTVRLEIRRIGGIKEGEDVIGNRVRVKVVKNKVAPPFKQVELELIFGQGVNRVGEILSLGTELGILKKAGSHYSFGDVRLGHGRKQVTERLADKPELREELENLIIEASRAGD